MARRPALAAAAVAVTPSTRRMRTSMSTTSGWWAATASSTSSPSSHSATTSNPSSGPRMRATPARTTGWSSTISTRITTAPRRRGPRRQRRQAGLDRASRRRSARPRARRPSARARSRMPDDAEVAGARRRAAAAAGRGRPRAGAARASSRSTVEHDGVAGRVAGHVGQRLAGDPVQRRARRARRCRRPPARRRPSIARPGSAVLVDERVEVGRAGQRRVGAPLVGAQRRDRRADLVEARPADGLGVDERSLGLVEVAPEHVAGAGDVEQHGGERVAGQVVQLAGDPAPLLGHGLLGQRLAGRLELLDQLVLAAAGPRPATNVKTEADVHAVHPISASGTQLRGDHPRERRPPRPGSRRPGWSSRGATRVEHHHHHEEERALEVARRRPTTTATGTMHDDGEHLGGQVAGPGPTPRRRRTATPSDGELGRGAGIGELRDHDDDRPADPNRNGRSSASSGTLRTSEVRAPTVHQVTPARVRPAAPPCRPPAGGPTAQPRGGTATRT